MQLSYGIHLIGVHLRQACNPYRAFSDFEKKKVFGQGSLYPAVEVRFLLVVLSSRTLFGVMASCGGGVGVESPAHEHGVTDVNRVWKWFDITQDQRCNRRFKFSLVC